MVAGDEDEGDARTFVQVGCCTYEVAVIVLVCIEVARAEYDAGFGNETRWQAFNTRERHLWGAGVFRASHSDNVVGDGGEVGHAGSVGITSLPCVAVADEHGAEPYVLDEAEAVGLVVVGEYFQLTIVNLGGRRVGRDVTGSNGVPVNLHGGNQPAQIGSCRNGDGGRAIHGIGGGLACHTVAECERHLCAGCDCNDASSEQQRDFLHAN